MEKVYCEKCREEFEDGEIVGMADGESYHAIFETPDNVSGCSTSCSDKKVKPGIYFKGKIYNMFDIVKVKAFKELKGLRENGRGVVIKGDLSDLVNQEAVM